MSDYNKPLRPEDHYKISKAKEMINQIQNKFYSLNKPNIDIEISTNFLTADKLNFVFIGFLFCVVFIIGN